VGPDLAITVGPNGVVISISWIAATALALRVPVVTQDEDYTDVLGLEVIRV
jgi:predicted nucleic acid-binding protein